MCLFLGPIYGSVNTAPDEFLEYYIGFVENENGGRDTIIVSHVNVFTVHSLTIMTIPFDPFIELRPMNSKDSCMSIDLYPMNLHEIDLMENPYDFDIELRKYDDISTLYDENNLVDIRIQPIFPEYSDSIGMISRFQEESLIPFSNRCVTWNFHIRNNTTGLGKYKQTQLEHILYWLNKKYQNFNYTVSETEIVTDSCDTEINWPLIPLDLYYQPPIKTIHLN